MLAPWFLEKAYHRTVDHLFAMWPQPYPDKQRLHDCKIIAHRGEHDNQHIVENTFAAFDQAVAAGVWGIECDVRWTRDLEPVVIHDPDCRRVFGQAVRICELTLSELKRRFPLIPALAELIARYSGKVHFMIEIKAEPYPDPERQRQTLQNLLAGLEPRRDYHFLTLEPVMFDVVDFAPKSALATVSQTNVETISEVTARKRYGGITGHYLFFTDNVLKRHRALGQTVGVGFVSSKNSLFREINRDVEWIFSNDAVKLQKIRDACL